MAHIQSKYAQLWQPEFGTDKISYQRMFQQNIDQEETNYLGLIRSLNKPQLTKAALRAINTSDETLFTSAMMVSVLENRYIYMFDRNSTVADDNDNIIAPTTGGGRWISISSYLATASIPKIWRGAADGVAPLDSTSKIPISYLTTNVANGLLVLNNTGKVATTYLSDASLTAKGIVQLNNIIDDSSTSAATPASVNTVINNLITTIGTDYAPKVHAINNTTYGAGNATLYGHLRLSDAVNVTSNVNGGIAATPAAVKSAYDLANSKVSKSGDIMTGLLGFEGPNSIRFLGTGSQTFPFLHINGDVSSLSLNLSSMQDENNYKSLVVRVTDHSPTWFTVTGGVSSGHYLWHSGTLNASNVSSAIGAVAKTGDTMTGTLVAPQIIAHTPSGVRLLSSNSEVGIGAYFMNDGSHLYLLLTNSGQAKTGIHNNLRPFSVNLATGLCNMNGNATSATTAARLQTGRYINGVYFDGSQDITLATMAGGNADTVGNLRPPALGFLAHYIGAASDDLGVYNIAVFSVNMAGTKKMLIYFPGGNIVPGADVVSGTTNLGSDVKRWNALYCVSVNQSSDERIKKDIENINEDLAFAMLDKIQPKTYRFKANDEKRRHGFIAQDLIRAFEELGISDFSGVSKTPIYKKDAEGNDTTEIENYAYGVEYTSFIPALYTCVKSLVATVKNSQKDIDELRNQVKLLLDKFN